MPLAPPSEVLSLHVEVEEAQLANPVVAVSRLLTNEAEAFARVSGDDRVLHIEIALADGRPVTRRAAEAWVRWALHNAGVRGRLEVVDPVGT